jgi:hypothetical protein
MKTSPVRCLAALALTFSIAACSTRAAGPTRTRETAGTPSPSPTKRTVSTIGTSNPAAVLPPVQRISPSSFSKNGVLFEVFAYSRMSCLKFKIQITSDRPIPPTPQDNTFEPVEQLRFLNGSSGEPLIVILEGRGGGGGGGAPGTPYLLSRDFLFDVKAPLPIPAIIALVTFHPSLGLSGPVRFDIQPTVRPNLGCPQLPPTTPEG